MLLGVAATTLLLVWGVHQNRYVLYEAALCYVWLSTYAEDARPFEHPGKLLTSGHSQIRERTAPRLEELNLHARLIKRWLFN